MTMKSIIIYKIKCKVGAGRFTGKFPTDYDGIALSGMQLLCTSLSDLECEDSRLLPSRCICGTWYPEAKLQTLQLPELK